MVVEQVEFPNSSLSNSFPEAFYLSFFLLDVTIISAFF